MHWYAYIQLTHNFLVFPIQKKKKIVVLWKVLVSFVHIMKFKYRSDQEAKDNKLSGLRIVSLLS